jgi:hypothetical protein
MERGSQTLNQIAVKWMGMATWEQIGMAEFEDIEIVALDENQTYSTDKSLGIYDVYFALSASPAYKWRRLFLAACAGRKASRKDTWRNVWIDGRYIVISAPLDEVQKVHHKNLIEDVKQANTNYRAFLDKMAKRQAEIFAEEENELKKITDLKKKLKL